jgi:hypothetical protein
MMAAAYCNARRLSGLRPAGAALVLTMMLAACTQRDAGNSTPRFEDSSERPRTIGGGELPGGPADSCTTNVAIGASCICGGAVHETGFCCEEGFSFSACSTRARYVLAGGGGAQDGSDWANAFGGLPGSLERDMVYWVGAGSYGGYTFDDSPNGQAGTPLRR